MNDSTYAQSAVSPPPPEVDAENSTGSAPQVTITQTQPPAISVSLHRQAKASLEAAVDHLLSLQLPEGNWCAELEGDSILQSEYILMMWIIGKEEDPRLPRITNHLRNQQREDGSWGQYPGGELGGGKFDLSATVKAYFCLKLMGDKITDPHMVKARDLILAHGGAERINSFSKFYLACLGQVRYSAVPTIPAQLWHLPKWFYFHLDKVSAWSRTMIIPLAMVTNVKPARELPEQLHIDELFVSQRNRQRLLSTGFGKSKFWTGFFLVADRMLKLADKVGLLSIGRESAFKGMEQWIIDHCKASDGPGAIFPPIVYLIIALQTCRGYAAHHPVLKENHRHLENYMIHGVNGTPRNKPEDAEPGDETIHLQPCESPVWDTGISAYALTDAGLDVSHEAMKRCADWLRNKEVTQYGDWAHNLPKGVKPAGWFFEYNNPWYPDVDDTVMVAMALYRIGGKDNIEAAKRGVEWVFAMQNDDGGWAAFDKGAQGRDIMDCVPFADHNALQDPSCPDITGRTLECLGHMGYTIADPRVSKAIDFIRSRQEAEGCWFGRWGVNYIYGTWQSVGGMRLVGQDMTADWVVKAGQWLRSVQQPDGSFGESCDSYEDPSLKGKGPSTASQTAWAAMTLMTIFGPKDASVMRAIAWLSQTQLDNGNWHEPHFTGTGFPKVFYLRYHYYKLYFPVMCLGRWVNQVGGD